MLEQRSNSTFRCLAMTTDEELITALNVVKKANSIRSKMIFDSCKSIIAGHITLAQHIEVLELANAAQIQIKKLLKELDHKINKIKLPSINYKIKK